jgi:hypothetical protein
MNMATSQPQPEQPKPTCRQEGCNNAVSREGQTCQPCIDKWNELYRAAEALRRDLEGEY